MARPQLTDKQVAYGKELGLAIQQARAAKKLSGGDLARASGVDLDALRRIERGLVASPGFALIAALRCPLGLSLDQLAARLPDFK